MAALLLPALMPFAVYADNDGLKDNEQHVITNDDVSQNAKDATKTSKTVTEKVEELKNKLWDKIVDQLKNARLNKQFNLSTKELARGLNLGGYYRIESNPSIAGKYSGIDIWEVNLAAYPQLFGYTPNIGMGLNVSRQVTYIQQFKTRKESLLRVPYDPITKLPRKSSVFFEKRKNIFTNEEEPVLKSGDFIAYRAPMSFYLGKGFSEIAAGHLGISGGASFVLSGEFDVHVFVMDNNFVRVKILSIKDEAKSASFSMSLLGFSGLGQMIISKLIDTNLLTAYISKSNSDLFIADYIFNLNDQQGRDLYDTFVGSKLHIFNREIIKDQIMAANPFASDDTLRNRILADLEGLNKISSEDYSKKYNDRRVLKLINAHNATETLSSGLNLSLFKILKAQRSESKTGAKITIYAQESNNVKARFKLDSFSLQSSFEFLVWGDKDTATNSLLTEVNDGQTPINLTGLQNTRIREDKNLRRSEFNTLMERLAKILPARIFNTLEKPDWNFNRTGSDSVTNAFVQQDITFNDKLFKLKSNISPEEIKTTLLDILHNYGDLKSEPMGAKPYQTGEDRDPIMEAFRRGNYEEAYADWELTLIPQKLSVALTNGYSFADRYAAFNYLYQSVPLFSEISTLLLLKLIPDHELDHVVIARLTMSARGQKTVIADFPTTEQFNTSNLFREILAQNSYINDRSYNLRNYIKEDGTLYTLDEIMINK